MFPFVMSDPRYFYPIKEPTVLIKGRDTLMPIDKVFGVMKVLIEAPDNLYFPILPERSTNHNKVMYHLKTMTGTWSSVEIQKAVRVGYKILDVYEQHHFPEKRNDLFHAYNKTFFNIKKQAKADGDKGLEAITKTQTASILHTVSGDTTPPKPKAHLSLPKWTSFHTTCLGFGTKSLLIF